MSGLLQVVSTLTLAAHLICMNVSSAGPLFCIWLERRFARTGDSLSSQLGRRLARCIILTFFLGIGFGLMLAGWMWISGRHEFFEALSAFSHKIRWGVWELISYLVAVLVYVWMWPAGKVSKTRTVVHRILAVFASTNLLYHFPPLFTAMAKYEPTGSPTPITPAEFRQLIFRHDVMSISVHFMLASVAVAGVCVIVLARRNALAEPPVKWPVVGAARISLLATAFQFIVGLWVALKLPPLEQSRVMGGNLIVTGCLILSVGLSFDLLGRLSALAFGDVTKKGIWAVVTEMSTIVVLMSATLWLAQL